MFEILVGLPLSIRIYAEPFLVTLPPWGDARFQSKEAERWMRKYGIHQLPLSLAVDMNWMWYKQVFPVRFMEPAMDWAFYFDHRMADFLDLTTHYVLMVHPCTYLYTHAREGKLLHIQFLFLHVAWFQALSWARGLGRVINIAARHRHVNIVSWCVQRARSIPKFKHFKFARARKFIVPWIH